MVGPAAVEGLVAEEGGGAILAVLDDQRLWTHGQNFARGQNQVVVVGQQLGLSIVDQERIEPGEHFGQIFAMAGDPVVHGVAAYHADLRHLLANVALQHGIDIGEKQEFAIFVGRRHLGGKGLEDVQLGVEGLGLVEVLHVRPGPVEAFARGVLQALRIHSATREHGLVFRR